MPYSVTWAPRDSCATTRHAGRLIGHPPRRQTWALGVPTQFHAILVSYTLFDVPLQGPGPVDPHLPSFPDRRLVVCIPVSCPWRHPLSPSCGQPPSLQRPSFPCSNCIPVLETLHSVAL